MMHSVFVTGTDTGCGKTTVAAALLIATRRARIDAVPFKPIQTGCVGVLGERMRAPDIDFCLKMASFPVPDAETYDAMAPYRFAPACSPHLAAERANRIVQVADLVTAARRLESRHDMVIGEGAGGILVPINRVESMLDLTEALGWPVLVAARSGLGTLNHTLLTIAALRGRDLPIAGVVLVDTEPPTGEGIEEDNERTLGMMEGVRILGRIPFLAQALEHASPPPPSLLDTGEKILHALKAGL